MTPIAQKSLGKDTITGLEQQITINQFTVDSEAEKVIVVYRIELLSPNGVVVSKSNPMSYERYNRPDVLYTEGDQIDENTIAKGGEVKTAGNMKFNLLRESTIGQMLTGMFTLDINTIQSVDTINEDLRQN